MKEVQPLVQSRSPVGKSGGRPGRTAAVPSSAGLTNFYPLYNGANDQVDAVVRVQPVQFQRIFPRYELSTSETRDLGLGPMFADIPENPAPVMLRSSATPQRVPSPRTHGVGGAATVAGTRDSLQETWLGRWVDLYA